MERFISLFGLFVMIGLAWLMSSNKKRVDVRIIVGGLLLQFLFAGVMLWTPPWRSAPVGEWLSNGISLFFNELQGFVEAGSGFMFGINPRPGEEGLPPSISLLRSFAFGVLPTVVVFSSLMSVLYYFGLMQMVVQVMARVMQKVLHVSGAESLSAAANVFVGHTEAPLVIKPYLQGMTLSELNAVMVGGFATISGGLLAAYAGMGIDAGHLVTASVISAPAALLLAKIMQPETETPETLGTIKVSTPRQGVNVIEAAAIGATDGMKLAMNIAAMLIAFLALIAMLDALIGWVGWQLYFRTGSGESAWSLAAALGYSFAPIAWLMGIESGDCLRAGELLGLKTVANEFIAFDQLGRWVQTDSAVELSPRTVKIMTYALSGFANFGAIGIQIGGIGGLAPERRSDLARLGLRAMIGGALACCMTACVAGVLI
ncbi:MAG: NupC/NupG family nucleoside CNT transporter [Planctomycetaceae bacterium]|nr:NupC/NupG family nucleoside CNT transporter [Planctomycetaceae bacterium]